jgi:hypothetical protein
VLVISISGNVYAWSPGREPQRLGSFGAPIDGNAALVDANTLVAVIEGNHLVDLDLVHGTRSTRSIAPQGLLLGPPAVRHASSGATLATVMAMTTTRVFVTTLDPSGQEVLRAPIANLPTQVLPDGGPQPLAVPPHTGVVVDARGAVAYASPDGRIGMVTAEGLVEAMGEVPCSRTGRSAGVAGLTPIGRGSFVVTCESGTVVRVTGPDAEPLRKLAPISPKRGAGPAPIPGPTPPLPPARPSEEEDSDDDETP